MAIEIPTMPNFHGEVWNLRTVYENDYYSESITGSETYCYDKEEACDGDGQWNGTTINASKQQDGSPDKCVCLWKQNEMEETAGSKYCPTMFQKDGTWVVDTYVNRLTDYTWCIQEDGKLCSRQTASEWSLPPDKPITSTSECKAYMEKNYPDTVYTTFRTTDSGAECKGFTKGDNAIVNPISTPTQQNESWRTMSTYKLKPGIATKVETPKPRKTNGIYKRWDGCTSGGKGGVWKRGTTDDIKPSAWPGSCWRFFDGTREDKPLIEADCQYPSGTIPTRTQAAALVTGAKGDPSNEQNKGTAQLLTNYCFQPIPTSQDIPSRLVSAPRTLSTNAGDKNICKDYKSLYPNEYDTGAETYCRSVHERYKDVPGFDFGTTGCQCWIDATISPNPGLESVLTSHLGPPPSCVWKACLPTGNQIIPIENNGQDQNNAGVWNTTCPDIPSCSNLINIGEGGLGGGEGSAVDRTTFNQQISCNIGEDGCKKNSDCKKQESCNDDIGLCVPACRKTNFPWTKLVKCKSGEGCAPESGLCVPKDHLPGGENSMLIIIIVVVSVIVLGLGGLGIWWWMKP